MHIYTIQYSCQIHGDKATLDVRVIHIIQLFRSSVLVHRFLYGRC